MRKKERKKERKNGQEINKLELNATNPLAEVVGEQQIPGEVVGERRVELQHLLQSVTLDDVQVAVGQRSHVSAGLSQGHLLPEHVPKHVALPCAHTVHSETSKSNTQGKIICFCYYFINLSLIVKDGLHLFSREDISKKGYILYPGRQNM